MKAHSLLLATLVASLILIAAGCSMLPKNSEAVAEIERQRVELEALRDQAAASGDAALAAQADAAIIASRRAENDVRARDAGDRVGMGFDALEALMIALGAGGLGGVASKLGKSRAAGAISKAQDGIDELWDKVSVLQAANAALRERLREPLVPQPTEPPSKPGVTPLNPLT